MSETQRGTTADSVWANVYLFEGDAATYDFEVNVAWVDRACPLCGSSDQSRVVAESNIDLQKLDSFAFASRKSPEHMHPRLIE